jgi:two-component system cell cycle sensor histidine kinase/response regulator CckA
VTRRWANDAAQVQNGLLRVHEDAKRAAALTRQLLFFSRRQVMQLRNVDLNEIVNQTAAMLRRIIGEDVRLELKLSSAPLQTRVDSGMIDQVLMNLAVNARDAMPEGGELRIETLEQVVDEETARRHIGAIAGRFVTLSVSDTGGGIPAEVLPRIFEPFFTTKEVGKGTGLGLATVTGIVQQHGGWIKVESEPGKGTCFQVFLPAHAYEVVKTKAVQTDFPGRRTGGSETILLVEDEPGVRTPMRRLIEKSGYRVLEAPDGVEALRIWKNQRENVSLLITDLVMPGGISGKQLAKSMVAEKPELKVIYSSGYSVDLASSQMALHGSEILLQKPFTPNQLLETIRNCLDGSGSQLCDSDLVGSDN